MSRIFKPIVIVANHMQQAVNCAAWLAALSRSEEYSYHLDDSPHTIECFTPEQADIIQKNRDICELTLGWSNCWEIYMDEPLD